VAGNAVISVRTPDRKNDVWKLRTGLNWLRLWSSDGFVIDDNDALAGFVRGANIFPRAKRHMIRKVLVIWSLAVCIRMPLRVTQTLVDIVIGPVFSMSPVLYAQQFSSFHVCTMCENPLKKYLPWLGDRMSYHVQHTKLCGSSGE